MIDNPSLIQHVLVEAISSFSWTHNFFIKFLKDILCIRTTYFSNRRKAQITEHPSKTLQTPSSWGKTIMMGKFIGCWVIEMN